MNRYTWYWMFFIAWVLLPTPSRVQAHEDGTDHDHGDKHANLLPKGLVLPALDGPKPWSDKPLFNDPRRFQIAIMTDRTGGHRPGIWEKGVRVVNLLRPEFVMSVGDLIEGYSDDPREVHAQWKEFLGFIDEMKMKFFFVPGNHDVSNPLMHKIWRDHFGPEWYSFDYKGVHFMALSSEDTKDQIGGEQLKWIEEDLEKSRDARWTLLFFHKPLWVMAEREIAAGNPDPTNWKRVEKLLSDRPHTVFAGHVHHYVQYDRNGQQYYHLATTGGGTQLRGVPYGEFDHVMWLTMEEDGPHTAIVMLDGVLAPESINEKGITRFRRFLAQAAIEVAPILIDSDAGFSSGRIDVRLTNGFDKPVTVRGQISGLPLRGLTVDPATIELKANAGETATLSLHVQFGETIAFSRLARTTLTANVTAEDQPSPLMAEKTVPVLIDRGFDCPPMDHPLVIDGVISDWPSLPLESGPDPLVLGPEGNWQGPKDGSIAFATGHDGKFVYFAASVQDDRVLPGKDALDILFDPRSPSARAGDTRLQAGTYRFRFTAPEEGKESKVRVTPLGPGIPPAGVQGVARRTDDGFAVELAVPVSLLARGKNADWHSFQLGVALEDVDQEGEKANQILWRGSQDYLKRNINFGHFRNTSGAARSNAR